MSDANSFVGWKGNVGVCSLCMFERRYVKLMRCLSSGLKVRCSDNMLKYECNVELHHCRCCSLLAGGRGRY
jgi:hypothetical protein